MSQNVHYDRYVRKPSAETLGHAPAISHEHDGCGHAFPHPDLKDGGLGPSCATPYADGGVDPNVGYRVLETLDIVGAKGKDFVDDDPDSDGDRDFGPGSSATRKD